MTSSVNFASQVCRATGPNSSGGTFYECPSTTTPIGRTYDLVSVSPEDRDLRALLNQVTPPVTNQLSLGPGSTCGVILRPDGDKHQRYACRTAAGQLVRVAVGRARDFHGEKSLDEVIRGDAAGVMHQVAIDPSFTSSIESREGNVVKGTFTVRHQTLRFELTDTTRPLLHVPLSTGRTVEVDDPYVVERFRQRVLGGANFTG
jgi:hypothetical protein